jgi:hypothetical protein
MLIDKLKKKDKKMSDKKIKTVNISQNTLDIIFEDLDMLSRLLNDMVSDMHNVKGGQQVRHAYMLYRDYIFKIQQELKKGIQVDEQQKTNSHEK